MLQAIQQLASDLAKQIEQNKSEDGYTIICTHRELRYMVNELVNEAILAEVDPISFCDLVDDAMNDFFDEMQYEHNLFLSVSQYDDVVLDEREEEF